VGLVLGRTRPHGLNLKKESSLYGLSLRKPNVHELNLGNSLTPGKRPTPWAQLWELPNIGEETNIMGPALKIAQHHGLNLEEKLSLYRLSYILDPTLPIPLSV